MHSRVIVGLMMLIPTIAAEADTVAPSPPEGEWVGKGQVGYVSSQGNTESKSAIAAIDLALLDGLWKHSLHLGGLYGQNSGIVSAERWDVLGQSNYDITADLYAFGALRYARDMFSGFEYQGSATAGIGYQFVQSATTKLSAQIGAGYRKSAPELLVKDAAGQVVSRTPEATNNNVIAVAGVDYSQAFTGTTTLSNKFLTEVGSSDTLLTDTLALTVKMSDRLALSAGYGLQDNTKPPVGLKKIDTLETFNLVFAF